MDIVQRRDLVASPWKNGGGVTYEIARRDADDGLLWRLSIAEVADDGPFSVFEGLTRILTVIEGAGLVLRTPDGPLQARPFRPVTFSGETPVVGDLVDGTVHDVNVIFDASRIAADVEVLHGPASCHLPPPASAQDVAVVLCLSGCGAVNGSPLPEGAIAMDVQGAVRGDDGARLLVVRLTRADGG